MADRLAVQGALEAGTAPEVSGPFEGSRVLAVDREGVWAAAFSSRWRRGEFYSDITFARYDDRWVELLNKGAQGSGDPPWRYSGHSPYLALRQEQYGLGLDVGRLTATAGIARPPVVAVRAIGTDVKEVATAPPFGAFIVLVIGKPTATVELLNEDGVSVIPAWPRRRPDRKSRW